MQCPYKKKERFFASLRMTNVLGTFSKACEASNFRDRLSQAVAQQRFALLV
jgi:hypothetical protein